MLFSGACGESSLGEDFGVRIPKLPSIMGTSIEKKASFVPTHSLMRDLVPSRRSFRTDGLPLHFAAETKKDPSTSDRGGGRLSRQKFSGARSFEIHLLTTTLPMSDD